MKTINLEFLGLDSWSRPVYRDENGTLLKDVDPRKQCAPVLCTSLNNAFDGEPDTPVSYLKAYSDVKFEFATGRITWN